MIRLKNKKNNYYFHINRRMECGECLKLFNLILSLLKLFLSTLILVYTISKSINIPLTIIIAELLRIIEKCKDNICDGEYLISNTLGGILYCTETLHATSLCWRFFLGSKC